MHRHHEHGQLVLGYARGRNGVSLICSVLSWGEKQTIVDLFSCMAIFEQRLAVLVFGGDTEPMVRVRHQAAPVGGKPCIGVVGILGVFENIGQLRVLESSAVHDLVEPIRKGRSHLGLQKRSPVGSRE